MILWSPVPATRLFKFASLRLRRSSALRDDRWKPYELNCSWKADFDYAGLENAWTSHSGHIATMGF